MAILDPNVAANRGMVTNTTAGKAMGMPTVGTPFPAPAAPGPAQTQASMQLGEPGAFSAPAASSPDLFASMRAMGDQASADAQAAGARAMAPQTQPGGPQVAFNPTDGSYLFDGAPEPFNVDNMGQLKESIDSGAINRGFSGQPPAGYRMIPAKNIAEVYDSRLNNTSDFVRGAKQALWQMPAAAAGVAGMAGSMVGSEGVKNWGMKRAGDMFARADAWGKPADDVMNFSPETAGTFVAHGLGYVATQFATALLPSGLAATGAKVLGGKAIQAGIGEAMLQKMAQGYTQEQAKQLVGQQVAKEMTALAGKGALAGAAGSSYVQEAGSIYADQVKNSHDNPWVAAGAAVPAAALDVVGELPILGKVFKGMAPEALQKMFAAPIRNTDAPVSLLNKVVSRAGNAAKVGALEGSTEGAQTVIERAGAFQPLTGADAMHDYANSVALGALGGTVMGGISGGFQQAAPVTPPAPTPRLPAPAEAPGEAPAAASPEPPAPPPTTPFTAPSGATQVETNQTPPGMAYNSDTQLWSMREQPPAPPTGVEANYPGGQRPLDLQGGAATTQGAINEAMRPAAVESSAPVQTPNNPNQGQLDVTTEQPAPVPPPNPGIVQPDGTTVFPYEQQAAAAAESKAEPKPAPAAKAEPAPAVESKPAAEPEMEVSEEELAAELAKLQAEVQSESNKAKVTGKVTKGDQGWLAAIARSLANMKVTPPQGKDKTAPLGGRVTHMPRPVIYKPKTATIDATATAAHAERMGKILAALSKLRAAAYDYYNTKHNDIPRSDGPQHMTAAAAEKSANETAKKAEKMTAALEAAMKEVLDSVDGNAKAIEALMAVYKRRAQSLEERGAAISDLQKRTDYLLSRSWKDFKENALTSLDNVRNGEMRASLEIKARAADTSEFIKAVEDGSQPRPGEASKGNAKVKGLVGGLNYILLHGTRFEAFLAQGIVKALKAAGANPTVVWLTNEAETPYYDPKDDTIHIHKESSPEVLLHESLHAALQWYVYANWDAGIQEIADLRAVVSRIMAIKDTSSAPKQVQQILAALRGKNAQDRVLELISYASTHNEFRNWLKGLKEVESDSPAERSLMQGMVTLWRKLTALVSRFLGVSQTAANTVMESTIGLLHGAKQEAAGRATAVNKGGKLFADVVSGAQPLTEEAITAAADDPYAGHAGTRSFLQGGFEAMFPGLFAGDRPQAAKVSGWISKVADGVRKKFPAVAAFASYINARANVSQKLSDIIETFKTERHSPVTYANNLADYIAKADPNSAQDKAFVQAIFDSLDGKQVTGLEKHVQEAVDTMRKTLAVLRDSIRDPKTKAYVTRMANSEILAWANRPENVSSNKFGAYKIDAFIPKASVAVVNDGIIRDTTHAGGEEKFYLLRNDKAGGVADGAISVALAKGKEYFGGLRIDNTAEYVDDGNSQANTKVQGELMKTLRRVSGAKEAIAAGEFKKLSTSLMNTVAILANNRAVQDMVEAMSKNGVGEAGHGVVFDSMEELKAHLGLRDTPQVLRWSDQDSKSKMRQAAFRRPGEFVHVPDTAAYGELRGKFVEGPVWFAIQDAVNREPFLNIPMAPQVMRFFKKAKTVYTLPTHVTNIGTNCTLAYLHNISFNTWHEAMGTYLQHKIDPSKLTDAQRRIMRDFEASGAVLGDFSTSEIKQEIYRAMNAQMRTSEGSLWGDFKKWSGLQDNIAQAVEKYSRKGSNAAESVDKFMTGLYAAEDNAFRLAAFMMRMGELKGEPITQAERVKQAGRFAKQAFLDYDIDSRAVQLARQTALPFVSWTYAIIPVLGRIAVTQPWKLANMLGVYAALDVAMAAMAGDDDEARRKRLGKEYTERLWGWGPHMMIRIPGMGDDKHPVYFKLGSFIPTGDMLKEGPGAGALPQAVTPNGPFVSLMVTFTTGIDPFTGKPIAGAADTGMEKAAAYTKYLAQQMSPGGIGGLALPWTREAGQAYDMIRGKKEITGGQPVDWAQAARWAGLKFYAPSEGDAAFFQSQEIKKLERDYKEKLTKYVRSEGRMEQPDRDKIREKAQEIAVELQEAIAKVKEGKK